MEMCHSSVNETTTEQHVSVPERCCYCIPHRLGLFVLTLLKLVLSFSLFIMIILTLYLLMLFTQLELFYPILGLMCITVIIGLVDIFIISVALVSICMKDQGMMEMYYRSTVYVLGFLTVLCCVILVYTVTYFLVHPSTHTLSRFMFVISILFCILLSILVIQVCLNQMVKREVRKMRSNEQIVL